jgi:hypothetical protein
MNRKQEQQITNHLNEINKNIDVAEQHLRVVDGAPKCLQAARFEIISAIGLLRRHNDEENSKKKTV